MSLETSTGSHFDNNHSLSPEEEDFELEFYALVDRIDDQSKITAIYKKILHDTEEEGDYETGLQRLREFMLKRGSVLDRTIFMDAHGKETRHEDFQVEFANIRRMIESPDAFLGNGAVAEVFSMKGAYHDQDICVKVIKNLMMYSKGNTIEREMRFLDQLKDIRIAGVRTPFPFYAFSNLQMRGMVMEQLNAYSLSKIFDGEVSMYDLPKDFVDNVKEYFSRIRAYVSHMHTLGIYHGDLFLRNLMIGRTSGDLYVIDFGKGRFDIELDKTKAHLPDYAKSDFAVLDSEEQKLTEYLQKNRK